MVTIIALIISVITFFIFMPILGRGAVEGIIIQLIIAIVMFMLSRYLLGTYVF